MTGESSAMSENPDQSPIRRGSQWINASLMPHRVATRWRTSARRSRRAGESSFVSGALAVVLTQRLPFVVHPATLSWLSIARGDACRAIASPRLMGFVRARAPPACAAADEAASATEAQPTSTDVDGDMDYLRSLDESPESRVGTSTAYLHLKDDRSATSLEG